MLALLLSPQRATAITGGQVDTGNHYSNVGCFAWPEGIDEDLDGIADWDPNRDGVPDVPASGGNLTLVHPHVVIGAAHVFQIVLDDFAFGYYTMEDIFVSFSPYPIQHTETYRAMTHVILHPDYDAKFLPGWGAVPRIDVAAIILKEPVTDITPATLAPAGFLDDLKAAGLLRHRNERAPFTVVGYGFHGKAPNKLIPPDGQRRAAVSEYMLLDDQWLFLDQNARHGNGGSQIWDSGGPTFWTDPITGEETLVALISGGDATGVAVGMNFRTDTAETLDFILDVIARVETGEFD
jgi:hypothetical protein